MSGMLGARALRALRLTWLQGRLDAVALGVPLGLGFVGLAVFFLGIAGGYTASALAFSLSLLAWIGSSELASLAPGLTGAVGSVRDSWRQLPVGMRALVLLSLGIGILSAVQALSPAWDYDGLMYHLQAPRLFLDAGRLIPLPEIWQANGPLQIEMLYVAALALGSEPTARLTHLTLAGLIVLATFILGREQLGETGGWLAAAVMLGIPIFPIWGTLAYSDMGWALFESLALLILLRWSRTQQQGWLVLAGLFAGLAAGSKYLGLAGLGAGVCLVLLASWRSGFKAVMRACAAFALPALVALAPWYLKNVLWLGDPVYPFLSGSEGVWGHGRLDLLMAYLRSFGAGKTSGRLSASSGETVHRSRTLQHLHEHDRVPQLSLPPASAVAIHAAAGAACA